MDVKDKKDKLERELNRKLYFISDGGHRQTADCVKSLCFADLVMLGGLFAGTNEADGTTIELNGEIYKSYSGSSTHKLHRIEGVKGIKKQNGSADLVIKRLTEGLQSGCSYQNCRNLQELKEDPIFIKISNAAQVESSIHDIMDI
jgi:IMP dehydrogenase